eukprot:TRINITY_DN3892_c0_g2_i1.p1 TRINITY_DN3892_c0_g2~~TRINITY_DN3892_c0_g2_i1.p1  ORF type:complete len:193 (+),score=67.58 TRINITY_DN3892_c0_g2_i1:144-722(+)
MSAFPSVDFQVVWKPFQLNPQAPREGINKIEAYNRKFGADRVREMIPRMARVFESEGLGYSMGGMTGNTFDSHRLAEWAKDKFGPAKQDALMTEMFIAYFSKEKYIGDHEVLVAAASGAGLPADDARDVLSDRSRYAAEVTEQLESQQPRITGVPFFIVHPPEGTKGRPYGLSGAQEPSTFREIFEDFGLSS